MNEFVRRFPGALRHSFQGGVFLCSLMQSCYCHSLLPFIHRICTTVTPWTATIKRVCVQTAVWKAPNAGTQPLPEAAARHERTLEAVGCSALFGQAPGALGAYAPATCARNAPMPRTF